MTQKVQEVKALTSSWQLYWRLQLFKVLMISRSLANPPQR